MEQIAVILEGMTHESTVHDNHNDYGPFPDEKLLDISAEAAEDERIPGGLRGSVSRGRNCPQCPKCRNP